MTAVRPVEVENMTAVRPVEVEITPDHSLAWTHFSHLSYDDFDRTEIISHWKLTKVFEAGRYHGLVAGILDFKNIVDRQYGIFVLGIHYTFQPALWRVKRGMCFPFKVSLEVVDMGRTSATVLSRLVNKLDHQTLATSTCKVVYVDRASRRPSPFPDGVISKHSALITHRRPLDLPTSPPQVPSSAHRYDVRVADSDTDFNGHTNQGSTFKFCMDAAQSAVRANRLPFQPDIGAYPLQECEVLYAGESIVGDHLQVFLWQQPDQQHLIRFVVKKCSRDNDQTSVIFHSYMRFDPTPVTRSLL